jgi:hypothetical protein
MILLHCKLNLHRIDGITPHLRLINLIVNNAHIVEPFAPIVVRRVNQVIVRVNVALQQSTSSIKSAKEEESEPRRCVVSNGDVEFEIVEPIAPIDLIAPLMHTVQRRYQELAQICIAWRADTNTPVLFEARIALDARFLPNIPVNCPHTPILRAKPSGGAQFPDLFQHVASEPIREGKQGEEKKALHLADCCINCPLSPPA